MAINISDKYPGRSNPPSVDYPQGSIKNQTAPGARDGTPLDEAWANDKEGFFQSILDARGITANGEVDKVGASQYYDALAADPTESLRGMPLVATQAETNAGVNDGNIITPKKLRAGFSSSLSSIGYIAFPSWLGGLILQWGTGAPSAADVNISFPLQFPAFCLQVIAASSYTPGSGSIGYVSSGGQSTTGFVARCSSATLGWKWFAVGF